MASIRKRDGGSMWQESLLDRNAEVKTPAESCDAVGVGISLSRQSSWLDCYPQISRVFSGGSAQMDGRIRQGDWLIRVDGRDVKYLPLNHIKEAILGRSGTSVQLELESDGTKFIVQLTRRQNNDRTEHKLNVSYLEATHMNDLFEVEKKQLKFTQDELQGSLKNLLEKNIRLESECKDVKERLAALQFENTALDNQNEESQQELIVARQKLIHSNMQLEAVNNALATAESEKKKLEEEIQTVQTRCMDLERQLEGYRQANERNESLVGCALLLLVLTVAPV
ncbi:hypothetical protein GUITHDRAFT_100958 [Guillardia theta CCMP2712]|uniref:PDZ domain-containing protein n=1 Tax=Guillardia theta (strain CCMP2712) TaxID=905079 RepID=L1JXE9_GUITC|nr:hypothetical protein GUITHDRAFT_100958 [Guillardia theta CCMP2712]EKX53251.1 hypothetical protein GUITHDRAFT_100958 [Guillardia theta CCMP2712]|eukprot:XP_005840231.1 hypothetical protein GUITHDRAFT_100958 [Guillardia theta CCMP2712]